MAADRPLQSSRQDCRDRLNIARLCNAECNTHQEFDFTLDIKQAMISTFAASLKIKHSRNAGC